MICLVLIHLFSLLVCPALGNFRLYQTYTNIPQLAVHDGEGILAGRFLDGFGSPSCDMVENATLYESIPDLNQGMGIAFRWDEPDEYKGSVEFNVPWGHYTWYSARGNALVDIHDVQVGTCTGVVVGPSYTCGSDINCDQGCWKEEGKAVLMCTTPLTPSYRLNTLPT